MLESKKVEEGEGLQEVEVERVPAVTEQNLPAGRWYYSAESGRA